MATLAEINAKLDSLETKIKNTTVGDDEKAEVSPADLDALAARIDALETELGNPTPSPVGSGPAGASSPPSTGSSSAGASAGTVPYPEGGSSLPPLVPPNA